MLFRSVRETEEEKEIERVSEGVCVCEREREGVKNYRNGEES